MNAQEARKITDSGIILNSRRLSEIMQIIELKAYRGESTASVFTYNGDEPVIAELERQGYKCEGKRLTRGFFCDITW